MSDIINTAGGVAVGVPIAEQTEACDSIDKPTLKVSSLRPDQLSFYRLKYRVDQVLAVVLLIVLMPVIAFLYVLVRISSPGPGLYRQQRLGENGKKFTMLKLRSMRFDAEAKSGPKWADKNDDRVTMVGRWLRKLHLDELTQLWNVARGEMSLVGPRPERPEISEVLHPIIDQYYDRLKVRPGVTGLAQINLPPDHTLEDAMRKQILDLNYIDHANFWLDFRMLVATALRLVGLRGETVMRMMFLCRRDLVRHIHDPEPQTGVSVRLPLRDTGVWKIHRPGDEKVAMKSHASVDVAASSPRTPR
tara:strand:+ start:55772 stop:56683 length:912 start_codon:yes stop_codon:yes gene_type:complete